MAATLLATAGSDPTLPYRRVGLGFTLIELLVTLAILAAIAALGTSLTQSWIDDARVNEASGQVTQAFAKTRALALRNETNQGLNAPAAAMCIANGVIYAQSVGSTAFTCGTNAAWRANLAGHPGTQVKTGEDDFSCIALNNRGIPTAYGACSISLSITVSKGSSHVVEKSLGGR